ncbi:MAG: LysR substrate-binding domain-containing protein [Rhodoferax sp.]|nr:LysR substrate-binding domain-containing protein [Rhodoferax sp.]
MNSGTVVAVRGSVVDVRFDLSLPAIHTVLHADEGRIVLEVLAQRDARHVRAIALTPTQGLARGVPVLDTGAPLKAPVGKGILARMFDVFGNAIDRQPAPVGVQWRSVHRAPPPLSDMAQESFVMYVATHAAGLHSAALLACQQAGFIPRVSQQAVQVQTVLALVESGLGVALVPSVMQRYISDRTVYRPLLDVLPQAAVGLALAYMEETGSAAAARFRQLATREFALEKSAGSLAASERRPATQARTVQGLPQPFS